MAGGDRVGGRRSDDGEDAGEELERSEGFATKRGEGSAVRFSHRCRRPGQKTDSAG